MSTVLILKKTKQNKTKNRTQFQFKFIFDMLQHLQFTDLQVAKLIEGYQSLKI